MNQPDWLENSKPHHLTIGWLKTLKKGQSLKVLAMDRNLEDITTYEKNNQENVTYDPQTFFRKNWAIYKHEKDTRGSITWEFSNDTEDAFEFHVEYKPDHWYPL